MAHTHGSCFFCSLSSRLARKSAHAHSLQRRNSHHHIAIGRFALFIVDNRLHQSVLVVRLKVSTICGIVILTRAVKHFHLASRLFVHQFVIGNARFCSNASAVKVGTHQSVSRLHTVALHRFLSQRTGYVSHAVLQILPVAFCHFGWRTKLLCPCT